MKTGWLDKAGRFKVEHIPCPHPLEKVDLSRPPAGVGHTIEGSLASGMGVFRTHYAPTFAVGPGRIIQCVPLGFMAAALENDPGGVETNRWARVQIEVEGHSQEHAWDFPASIRDPLAALLATLSHPEIAGIPLSRPFPDKMPPGPWATESFKRRHAGKWGVVPGWYAHVEIPENAHWDCGALLWTHELAAAKLLGGAVPVVKPKPRKHVPFGKTHRLKRKTKKALPALHHALRSGSKGPMVRSLQQALAVLGYQVTVDGDFGLRTKAAVASFQRAQKLRADGVAGPATLRALRASVPGVI